MLKVKQEYKDCATIKELNVLYQKYMGMPLPAAQAHELGQTHMLDGVQTVDNVEPGLKV